MNKVNMKRMDERSKNRAADLFHWLRDQGWLKVDGDPAFTKSYSAIQSWMLGEFRRGVDYGKRLERNRAK